MCNSDSENSNQLEDFEFEPCLEINQEEVRAAESIEDAEPRGWSGLVNDAPGCSTAIVNGLSQQLIHQMNVITANTLVSFDDLNVSLEAAAWPFLQPPAREALGRAIQERGRTLKVNSAYRTIAQQFLLYKWGKSCGYPVVAAPGKSNHQSGVAIDIEDHTGWRPYLEKHGWRWFGDRDRPHFDYKGGGARDIRRTAMLAFQQLWNKNHPNAKILEDGIYGGQLESCLNKSPAKGFQIAPWDNNPRILKLCQPILQGSDVRKVQEALLKAGYTVTVDEIFGKGTDTAVRQFQEKNGLKVDGVVGQITLKKLIP